MLTLRTLLRLEVRTKQFSVVGEPQDSWQELADSGSPIDTTVVTAVELLQAYAALRFGDPFFKEARSEVRFGRQTLDVDHRRLATPRRADRHLRRVCPRQHPVTGREAHGQTRKTAGTDDHLPERCGMRLRRAGIHVLKTQSQTKGN